MKKVLFSIFIFIFLTVSANAASATPDIQISNIYVDNNEVEQMPKKNEGYYFKKTECTNGVKGTFDENAWELTLNGISSSSSCKVYFTSKIEEKAKNIDNPDTGTFMNIVIILSGILLASSITILAIRKKIFYRI